jgi:hypothetical protein
MMALLIIQTVCCGAGGLQSILSLAHTYQQYLSCRLFIGTAHCVMRGT